MIRYMAILIATIVALAGSTVAYARPFEGDGTNEVTVEAAETITAVPIADPAMVAEQMAGIGIVTLTSSPRAQQVAAEALAELTANQTQGEVWGPSYYHDDPVLVGGFASGMENRADNQQAVGVGSPVNVPVRAVQIPDLAALAEYHTLQGAFPAGVPDALSGLQALADETVIQFVDVDGLASDSQ